MGTNAFASCKLSSVSIANGVTCIGNASFCLSGLKSIYIPDSITSIGIKAFDSCSLNSAIFEDPNGWYLVDDNNTNLSAEDLSTPDKAATYLRLSSHNLWEWRKEQ